MLMVSGVKRVSKRKYRHDSFMFLFLVNQITNQTQSLTIIPPKNRYDESILTRMVAARLDLPITQKLLNEKFAIGVVRRCWENQLRLIGMIFYV